MGIVLRLRSSEKTLAKILQLLDRPARRFCPRVKPFPITKCQASLTSLTTRLLGSGTNTTLHIPWGQYKDLKSRSSGPQTAQNGTRQPSPLDPKSGVMVVSRRR